ncbi:hypothetical protein H4219_000904 [Mycoemilia scoparia]|uniref:Uncharacterized protein n=1 Tax=Mycoemilia scoparia TaxID=417184 RepID=A0A9W8A1M9_9FUNG|nr:hypothetical protein H4219_000904 [Mycoemilia scoparia]
MNSSSNGLGITMTNEASMKPPNEWSIEEVCQWLRSKNVDSNSIARFKEQEIDGMVLIEYINYEILHRDMGIVIGKALRIINAINGLKKVFSKHKNSQENHSPSISHNDRNGESQKRSHSVTLDDAPSLDINVNLQQDDNTSDSLHRRKSYKISGGTKNDESEGHSSSDTRETATKVQQADNNEDKQIYYNTQLSKDTDNSVNVVKPKKRATLVKVTDPSQWGGDIAESELVLPGLGNIELFSQESGAPLIPTKLIQKNKALSILKKSIPRFKERAKWSKKVKKFNESVYDNLVRPLKCPNGSPLVYNTSVYRSVKYPGIEGENFGSLPTPQLAEFEASPQEDDEILPLFGESEEEYLSDKFIQELESEEKDRETKAKKLKEKEDSRQKLVKEIIERKEQEYREAWNLNMRPKLEIKARKLWVKWRSLRSDPQTLEEMRNNLVNVRLPKAEKAIMDSGEANEKKIVSLCSSLQHTVYEICKHDWMTKLLSGSKPKRRREMVGELKDKKSEDKAIPKSKSENKKISQKSLIDRPTQEDLDFIDDSMEVQEEYSSSSSEYSDSESDASSSMNTRKRVTEKQQLSKAESSGNGQKSDSKKENKKMGSQTLKGLEAMPSTPKPKDKLVEKGSGPEIHNKDVVNKSPSLNTLLRSLPSLKINEQKCNSIYVLFEKHGSVNMYKILINTIRLCCSMNYANRKKRSLIEKEMESVPQEMASSIWRYYARWVLSTQPHDYEHRHDNSRERLSSYKLFKKFHTAVVKHQAIPDINKVALDKQKAISIGVPKQDMSTGVKTDNVLKEIPVVGEAPTKGASGGNDANSNSLNVAQKSPSQDGSVDMDMELSDGEIIETVSKNKEISGTEVDKGDGGKANSTTLQSTQPKGPDSETLKEPLHQFKPTPSVDGTNAGAKPVEKDGTQGTTTNKIANEKESRSSTGSFEEEEVTLMSEYVKLRKTGDNPLGGTQSTTETHPTMPAAADNNNREAPIGAKLVVLADENIKSKGRRDIRPIREENADVIALRKEQQKRENMINERIIQKEKEKKERRALARNTTSRSSVGETISLISDSEDEGTKGANADENRIVINPGDDISEIYIPEFLGKVLKEHQIEGIRFMWKNIVMFNTGDSISNHGCVLAHSMGLGKTLQIITFIFTLLNEIKSHNKQIPSQFSPKRVLIVCPATLQTNWCDEFKLWFKGNFSLAVSVFRQVYNFGKVKPVLEARMDILKDWYSRGGIIVMGYPMFRNLIEIASRYVEKTKDETGEVQPPDMETDPAVRVSYDLHRYLIDPGPSLIICDEGHNIKNSRAKLSILANSIKTRSRICLTGYPLQNNLLEYWTMVNFVFNNYLGDVQDFRNAFINPIDNGLYADSTKSDRRTSWIRLKCLQELLDPIVLRRDASILHQDLPKKVEMVISCPLTEAQLTLYYGFIVDIFGEAQTLSNDGVVTKGQVMLTICNHPAVFKEQFEIRRQRLQQKQLARSATQGTGKSTPDTISSGLTSDGTPSGIQILECNEDGDETTVQEELSAISEDADDTWAWNALSEVMEKCDHIDDPENSAKVVLMLDIIRNCVFNGEKVLLFTRSVLTLNYLERIITKTGVATPSPATVDNAFARPGMSPHIMRLDGTTPVNIRQGMIDRFNQDNMSITVFLISTGTGSLGVNLVSATRVILFDVGWNPLYDEQAIARAYRYGQQRPVFVYRLKTAETWEDKLFQNNVHKVGLSKRVVDKRNLERQYTKKEMAKYFTPPPLHIPHIEPENVDSIVKESGNDKVLKATLNKYLSLVTKVTAHATLLEDVEEDVDNDAIEDAKRMVDSEKLRLRHGGPDKIDALLPVVPQVQSTGLPASSTASVEQQSNNAPPGLITEDNSNPMNPEIASNIISQVGTIPETSQPEIPASLPAKSTPEKHPPPIVTNDSTIQITGATTTTSQKQSSTVVNIPSSPDPSMSTNIGANSTSVALNSHSAPAPSQTSSNGIQAQTAPARQPSPKKSLSLTEVCQTQARRASSGSSTSHSLQQPSGHRLNGNPYLTGQIANPGFQPRNNSQPARFHPVLPPTQRSSSANSSQLTTESVSIAHRANQHSQRPSSSQPISHHNPPKLHTLPRPTKSHDRYSGRSISPKSRYKPYHHPGGKAYRQSYPTRSENTPAVRTNNSRSPSRKIQKGARISPPNSATNNNSSKDYSNSRNLKPDGTSNSKQPVGQPISIPLGRPNFGSFVPQRAIPVPPPVAGTFEQNSRNPTPTPMSHQPPPNHNNHR